MADLDLTGYKLTFSDEFNTRSISATEMSRSLLNYVGSTLPE